METRLIHCRQNNRTSCLAVNLSWENFRLEILRRMSWVLLGRSYH